MLADAGIGLSAIGSPIGKVPIDSPFEPHLDLFKRAIELCGVFGTMNIRVFSYYPPEKGFDGNWAPYRDEVIRRMRVKAELAAASGVTLFHENEHKIYGDEPTRVRDLMATVNHPNLRSAYDAANWVFCGYDPRQGWDLTKEFTSHLHIKDWKKPQGDEAHGHGVIPGTGDGDIAYSIRDAVTRGYDGFATMEPHLRGGGPTGGVTGPDLFPYAVEAFRKILADCGGQEG
jgi:sugar phosphate isomerase/epimerase